MERLSRHDELKGCIARVYCKDVLKCKDVLGGCIERVYPTCIDGWEDGIPLGCMVG